VTPDEALIAACKLGLGGAASTSSTEELLPTLITAGFALAGNGTWRLTTLGVTRAQELLGYRRD
jgi:hypothetical protein